nr:RNA-directed DNA polymerase, eukaryota, reverse transcriptase zinc-binding domain protein [Tanacetum cinerariifolium]
MMNEFHRQYKGVGYYNSSTRPVYEIPFNERRWLEQVVARYNATSTNLSEIQQWIQQFNYYQFILYIMKVGPTDRNDCPICLEDFRVGQEIHGLPYAHNFQWKSLQAGCEMEMKEWKYSFGSQLLQQAKQSIKSKYKLDANAKGQFQTGSYVNVVNGLFPVGVHGPSISSASVLVLDDSCVAGYVESYYRRWNTLRMMNYDVGPQKVPDRSLFCEEGPNDDRVSDVEEVSKTNFGDNSSIPIYHIDESEKQHSEDPFNIYKLLRKQPGDDSHEVSSSFSHPPGFTPDVSEASCDNVDPSVVKKGGSVLGVMEDMIRVGKAMGYSIFKQVSQKLIHWDYVSTLIDRWNGEVVVLGDFNEVRNIDERRGSCFNPTSARVFDQFISASGLVDVKMKGYTFTWSNPSGSKMSKLDRFLVFEGIFSIFPSITAVCIDRHLSDHRPIILCEVQADFGLIPFRFYHSWISLEGFDAMVEQTWRLFSHNDANRMIRFKKKIQDLKIRIRAWIKDKRSSVSGEKDSIKKELNGIWCTNPNKVKVAFFKHFEARFKKPVNHRLKINFLFSKRLSDVQASDVERRVSRDEIRLALWNCKENKSPDLDGYSFEFFRKYWNLFGSDLCDVVERFFKTGSFLNGCNSSFVALISKITDAKFVNDFWLISLIGSVYKVVTNVLTNQLALVISDLISDTQYAFVANRQILDGPFILNELLHWCKRKKKQVMFFKVDFAKAYDSVHWDYLLDVLEAFGFGNICCKWIWGTFSSIKASVLVNGSPTIEFLFHCGLKQGNPLSPYLFILIMKSLNMSFTRAIDEGVFKGVHLHGSTSISHLFYANDVMFIGEWSDDNLKGGRLTLLKAVLGASPLYNMSIFKVPKGILNSMEAICSKFFNGMEPSTNKITWAAWNKVLASKGNMGLGVSSYHALNRALLFKWVWRFISQDGSLWFRVIKALYGTSIDSHPVNLSSNWCSIIHELHLLVGKGFYFLDHCKKRIENGRDTCFWYDNWLGDKPLKDLFPRLFALELNKEVTVADKVQGVVSSSFRRPVRAGSEYQHRTDLNSLMESVSLSHSCDRWICDLSGDGEFRVKGVRNFFDNLFLPSYVDATRCVKYIPIKMNVFVWRARRDFLPTRVNLSRRGNLLESSSCPLFLSSGENIHHVLFGCGLAESIFRRICRWWELDWQALESFSDWNYWFSLIRLSSKVKALLEGVFGVAWWSIWGFRNRTTYN